MHGAEVLFTGGIDKGRRKPLPGGTPLIIFFMLGEGPTGRFCRTGRFFCDPLEDKGPSNGAVLTPIENKKRKTGCRTGTANINAAIPLLFLAITKITRIQMWTCWAGFSC